MIPRTPSTPEPDDQRLEAWLAKLEALTASAATAGPEGLDAFFRLGDMAQAQLQYLEEQLDLLLWDPDDVDDAGVARLHDLDGIIRPSGGRSIRAEVAAWMDEVRRTKGNDTEP